MPTEIPPQKIEFSILNIYLQAKTLLANFFYFLVAVRFGVFFAQRMFLLFPCQTTTCFPGRPMPLRSLLFSRYSIFGKIERSKAIFGKNQIFIDVKKQFSSHWHLLSKRVVGSHNTFNDAPLQLYSLIHSTLRGCTRLCVASTKKDPDPWIFASDPQSAKSNSFLSESTS